MKKTLAVATIAMTLPQVRRTPPLSGGGGGAGGDGEEADGDGAPGVAAGAIGGAVIAGAIVASRPPGYVVYPGYAERVYGPGCYWTSQPVYDNAGRVVDYSGQPVQGCPPPPGYGGAPPPGYGDAPPPGYGDAPPPRNVAPRRKPPAKQQQVQPKQDSKQQVEPKDQE
jgi:hypothetical protein